MENEEKPKLQNTEAAFKPKARIMELLGEQLIKNHILALFELVKNAYDADADRVKLNLIEIDKDSGTIEIQDDGSGMDFETVTKVWMEPAHGHKLERRALGKRTKKGRLQVGEKGVGRFAVHRLGAKILMITKAENSPEVVVDIDWNAFSQVEYLEDAKVKIFERPPETFKTGTGTKIQIHELKQQWRRGDVRRLYRSVKAMTQKPLSTPTPSPTSADKAKPDSFEVEFNLKPDNGWLDDLFDPVLAESQSLFSFEFELTDTGLHYKYKYSPYESIKADYKDIVTDRPAEETIEHFEFFRFQFPDDDESWKTRKKRNHRPKLSKRSDAPYPAIGIGPLKGKIIGFDFDKEIIRYLKDEKGGLEDYVKQQGGIKVYRDGLRVYNYGEPGDDWLGLDHRRIQGPTRKFGNRQIIGELHLDLEESSELKEKTNREGFVENEAYNELVYAMLCIISQFEAERNKDKRKLKDALNTTPGTYSGTKKNQSIEELINELEQSVLKNTELDLQIGSIVRGVSKSYRETRDAMLSAAGAGLGLVTVFHELERGVRGLNASIQEGVPPEQLKHMSNELVSLLQGAMYMVSNRRMEEFQASELVRYALLTQQRRFRRHEIKFLNGFENSPHLDFKIKGMRRMLTSTIVNIIDNAIHWIDEAGTDKYIWISPSQDLEAPAILIADSGTGFMDEPTDIVQPFFTRKPAGMGIGLYYADMVMKAHAGRLAFPETNSIDIPKVLTGACVGLVFKKDEL